MASSLDEFLSIKEEEDKIETVTVTVKGGKELEVDVKNLTLNQFKQCKKKATNSYDNPNGGIAVAQVEEITFSQQLCALGIVDPPLSNARLRKKFNVHSNLDLVAKMFPPKSILKLGSVIGQLTLGDDENVKVYDGTDPELVEEAKN